MLNKETPPITLLLGDYKAHLQNLEFENTIIVTDPPFNIGYHYRSYGDKLSETEYYKMLRGLFFGRMSVVVHYLESLHRLSIEMGMPPKSVVSWVYNSNTGKQHRDIAFYNVKPDFRKGSQPYKNPMDKRIAKRIAEGKTCRLYDWWEINQIKNIGKEKTEHPCQMPVEVMKRIITLLPDGFTIFDPFMGSGTTGVACRELKRNFIGCEIDETYFNISTARINSDKFKDGGLWN
jgi:DNA modification methylase